MKSFGTWFRDFFLYSLPCREEDFNNFLSDDVSKKEESIELKKLSTRLSWLFGSTLYLTGFAFCLWILALSAIHLTTSLKDKTLIEKILFFASPNTWKEYFLRSGGFFNAFRKSGNKGEYVFIFLSLGLVLSSLLSLIFSLVTINISAGKNLKELRLVSLGLCLPVFGWIIGSILILHFFFVGSKEKLQKWARNKYFIALFFKRYFDFLERREESKAQFKPKQLEFLELKKKENKLSNLGEVDKYVVKKI